MQLTASLVLVLAVASAVEAADALIVRQRIQVVGAAEGSREQTLYYSGSTRILDDDRIRSIIDLDRKTSTTINKKTETYSVSTFKEIAARDDKRDDQVKDLPEPVREMINVDAKITLRPTGKHDQIAGYDTEEVVVEGKDISGKVWITKEIEAGPRAKEWAQLASLYGNASAPGAKLERALAEQNATALRRELAMPPLPPVTVEVIEIRRGPIDAKLKGVPEGFKKVDPARRR